MNFKTIKEMKEKLSQVTDVNDLHQNMSVYSQGQLITLRYIGDGSVAFRGIDGEADGNMSSVYVSDETASSARVEYTGRGNSINVTYVTVNKQV